MVRRRLFSAILLATVAEQLHSSSDVINGLAVYRVGEGEPVLLMPYPHASGVTSMVETDLTGILIGLGRTVVTFDPPGVFCSTRNPKVHMDEMLGCSLETLEHFGINGSIDVVGHSMGSFCALAFALEYGNRVKKLVLIGSTSGWPAIRKWGIQRNLKRSTKKYWMLIVWGFVVFIGLGNLKIHKQLDRLMDSVSYVDKSFVMETFIYKDDRRKPLPERAKWPIYLRKQNVDYKDRLGELNMPVLICVGHHDPVTPLIMNQELHEGIKDSRLVIFEKSGHFPFVEEIQRFSNVLDEFLTSNVVWEENMNSSDKVET
jgi:pimeloyl-ACP methyl ester carboxylesterase